MSRKTLNEAGKNGLKGPEELHLDSIIWALRLLIDSMIQMTDDMQRISDLRKPVDLRKTTTETRAEPEPTQPTP